MLRDTNVTHILVYTEKNDTLKANFAIKIFITYS